MKYIWIFEYSITYFLGILTGTIFNQLRDMK